MNPGAGFLRDPAYPGLGYTQGSSRMSGASQGLLAEANPDGRCTLVLQWRRAPFLPLGGVTRAAFQGPQAETPRYIGGSSETLLAHHLADEARLSGTRAAIVRDLLAAGIFQDLLA